MSRLSFICRRRQQFRPGQSTPAVIVEYGRRQLIQHAYLLPKDGQEYNRLDFQHFYLKAMFGTNTFAPLPRHVSTVLDVGCGSGVWVRELVQQFPQARVVGLDLELPPGWQAGEAGRGGAEPNYEFRTADVLKGLPFAEPTFDYTHQRLLAAAIPTKHWPREVGELVRVTQMGGWVELVEISGSYLEQAGPASRQMLEWGQAVGRERGLVLDVAPRLHELLLGAGLSRVELQELRVPLGRWGERPEDRHAGGLLAKDIQEALRALKALYCRQLLLPAATFERVVEALAGEWEQYHTEAVWYVAFGQRI